MYIWMVYLVWWLCAFVAILPPLYVCLAYKHELFHNFRMS